MLRKIHRGKDNPGNSGGYLAHTESTSLNVVIPGQLKNELVMFCREHNVSQKSVVTKALAAYFLKHKRR